MLFNGTICRFYHLYFDASDAMLPDEKLYEKAFKAALKEHASDIAGNNVYRKTLRHCCAAGTDKEALPPGASVKVTVCFSHTEATCDIPVYGKVVNYKIKMVKP